MEVNKQLVFAIVVGITMWYGIVWLVVRWLE